MQKQWTDDTEVYIDFDAPYCYAIDEVTEDEVVDAIILHTHPFGINADADAEDNNDFEVV